MTCGAHLIVEADVLSRPLRKVGAHPRHSSSIRQQLLQWERVQ